MTSVITAELLAFLSIPLAATLMSRGVGYADWLPWQARGVALCRCPALADALPYADALLPWASRCPALLPWQAGAAPVVLALGGLGFKYVKEALDCGPRLRARVRVRARVLALARARALTLTLLLTRPWTGPTS